MNEQKCAAITAYLSEKFPDCPIEQKYDSNRMAQSFKVHVIGTTLLLKVSDEFVGDNDIPEILRQFNLWALAEVLGNEKELGVLVSHGGLELFPRD
jgi:hypothetical protein